MNIFQFFAAWRRHLTNVTENKSQQISGDCNGLGGGMRSTKHIQLYLQCTVCDILYIGEGIQYIVTVFVNSCRGRYC